MTDHPNAELLRKGYEAFAKGDMDAVQELFSDDIVWHNPGDNMLSGDYRGKGEVLGFFATLMQETGGNFGQEIHDLVASDDHGIVLVRQHSQRKGKSLDQNGVHVWHMSGGKATEFWGFPWDQKEVDEFWS